MQTQKDHVHAYQFLMQRMTTALTVGDPSNMEPPTRRGRSGLLTGALIALLTVIGFGVYGLFVPGGNTAWKQKGVILVEKESGTRYVYLNGALVSTPNLVSAMLIQGGGNSVTTISRKSLAGLPRGTQMGIPGAPDVVPGPQDLLAPSWLLCPTAPPDGGKPGVLVNFYPSEHYQPVPEERYAVVKSSSGGLHIIWRDSRHRIPDVASLVVFGLAATPPLVVPDAVLDLVPEGPALIPAPIAGAGGPGQAVAGVPRRIGDLFTHDPGNGNPQRYVLQSEGLTPISETEFALQRSLPGKSPIEVDAQSILSAQVSPDRSLLTRLPDVVRKKPLDDTIGHPCLRQESKGDNVFSYLVAVPGAQNWPAGVWVPPYKGLLVAEVPAPQGQKTPDRYLITDRGRRFLVPDNDSIQALGLGGAQPIAMRAEVLSLIYPGPALTRSAVVVEQGG
jgi:type VII secretion protein EccB